MDEIKEKKSGSAAKVIVPAVVGIVLAAILLIVAVATGNLGGNPKKTLAKAMDKTFTLSGDAIQDAWQMDGYTDMFENEQMHVDADIDLSGLGNIAIQFDKDKEQCGLLMGIGYYGVSLLEANLYMDAEEMRLEIPEWLDYVLYLDLATYDEDIETFIKNYDIDDELADELRVLGEELKAMNRADDGKDAGEDESLNEAFEQLEDAVLEMTAGVEVAKTDSKKLTVNGRERNCKGYVAALDESKTVGFIQRYKEIYESSEALQDYFAQMMASAAGTAGEYDLMLEAFDIMEDAVAKAGDIQIYCYVYDGVLAQVSFENEGLSFEWNICGGNFPLENTDLTLAYDSEEIVLRRRGSLEGTEYEAEYQISVDGEELTLAAGIDKEDGDFRFELEEEYYFSMLLKGNIEKTVPGSEYVITIDTFKIDNEELLYGDVTVSNECGEIQVPDGDLRNVLKMTEDDWYDVLWELFYYLY